MNFEERNASWTGTRREFQQLQTRAAKPGYWAIEVRGPDIITTWGRLDGKMQEAIETKQAINVGKANEKSGAQYALERAREMARKKHEYEGYREFHVKTRGTQGGYFLDPIVEDAIDFDSLPPTLSFYKPDNSMGTRIEKLARANMAWFTRKRNGMAMVLCTNSKGQLNIYSRRMLRQHDDEIGSDYTWDDRFPHLVAGIQPYLPPKTILLGEFVVEEGRENIVGSEPRERFDLAQSYIKSLTPKAVKDMEDSKLFPFFYCWDIAFWGGDDWVSKKPVRERYEHINTLDGWISNPDVFEPIYIFHPSHKPTIEMCIENAKKYGWEGWVVVDPDGIYGDKAYNFSGKPHRPRTCCAKLKPEWEDDFVAIWDPDRGFGERSTKGSRDGGIKSVGLYQYDKNGQLVFISNISSGLTDEILAENAHPKKWPQVWKVWYSGRRYISDGDDTNALDFPRIDSNDYLRTKDKSADECINERL